MADKTKAAMRIEYVDLSTLLKWPGNPKSHDAGAINSSLDRFGYVEPVVVDEKTGRLVAGHGRLETLEARRKAKQPPPKRVKVQSGRWLIPVLRGVEFDTEEEAQAYLLAANRLVYLGGWDEQALADMLGQLAAGGEGAWKGTGFEADDLSALLARLAGGQNGEPTELGEAQGHVQEESRRTLAERFGVPPFSVLDARQGYWQERKRAWINLGIQSEIGRGGNALGLSTEAILATRPAGPGESRHYGDRRDAVRSVRDSLAKGLTPELDGRPDNPEAVIPGFYEKLRAGLSREQIVRDFLLERAGGQSAWNGTSIFDPVLCELACRWFCPEGGRVLDPFAGGSVRGVVAGRLGREYLGLDLRPEQIEANRSQAERIFSDGVGVLPHWAAADARDLDTVCTGDFDLLFTCPPYFDLEKYSEDKRDLSAAEGYEAFLEALGGILKAAVARLKDDRFAVLVLGEIRDRKTGFYRGLVPDAIGLMEEAGANFYNEAVLVMSVSSLPIRVGKQFGSYRKLGRCHQSVLVFFKGDWSKIPESLAATEWGDLGLPQVEGEAEGFVADEEPA